MTNIERGEPLQRGSSLRIPGTIEQGPMERSLGPSIFSQYITEDLARDIAMEHLSDPKMYVSTNSIERMRIARKVEDMLRKNNFNGYIANERAVIVEPNVTDFKWQTPPNPQDVRSFVGAFDLLSTGRGNVGTFTYKISIALKDMLISDIYPFAYPKFSARIHPLNTSAIELLISQSSDTWHQAVGQAIRTAMPAGLPGLGKR